MSTSLSVSVVIQVDRALLEVCSCQRNTYPEVIQFIAERDTQAIPYLQIKVYMHVSCCMDGA